MKFKKRTKIGLITGASILATTSIITPVVVLSAKNSGYANFDKIDIHTSSEVKNSAFSFSLLREENKKYFDGIFQGKNSNLTRNFKSSSNVGNNEEQIKFALSKANTYINILESENITSLDEIKARLVKEDPRLKEKFAEEEFKVSNDISSLQENDSLQIQSRSYKYMSRSQLLDFNSVLENQSSTLTNISIISAIAAAGFWASSWWFGITIPWAVASTAVAVSALSGTLSGLLNSARQRNITESNQWWVLADSAWNAYSTFSSAKTLLIVAFGGAATLFSASVWAFPATTIAVSAVGIVLSTIASYS